jgi:DsbC/DsbD-like thiol-disulfide interchange protein
MRMPGFVFIFPTAVLAFAATVAGFSQDIQPPGRDPRFKPPGTTGPGKTGEQLVKVRSLVDSEDLRPGDTFHLVFVFDIEPGWHIYWQNPGSSGAPTVVQVKAPVGFTVGKTKFPRPEIFKDAEGQTYGHQRQTALFVEVTATDEVQAGKAHFSANLNWLVCKEACLMGRNQQTIDVAINPKTLPGAPPRQKPEPSSDPVVQQFQKRLPEELSRLDGADSKFDESVLTVRLPANSHSTATFYPIHSPGVTYGETTVKKEADALVLSIPVTVNPNNSLGEEMKVAGVVGLGDSKSLDEPCYQFEIPLPGS